jgi:hypothetical protein
MAVPTTYLSMTFRWPQFDLPVYSRLPPTVAVLHTVPYRTVPYRTIPHCTVPYRTVLYRTAPYRIGPYSMGT